MCLCALRGLGEAYVCHGCDNKDKPKGTKGCGIEE